MATNVTATQKEPLPVILKKAAKRALGGGTAGAMGMACNVILLMWIRTIMNYQYRHGTTLKTAATTLYNQGGVRRFYRGLAPALLQGPLSRFGDTAANAGMISLLSSSPVIQSLPDGPRAFATTSLASLSAAAFRILLMPIDTFKTVLQVEGANGISIIMQKYRTHGISVFYHGSLAAMAATFAGHFPWFTTYNYLNSKIPEYDDKFKKLLRAAGMGFTASVVSDSVSNSIRVVKTYRQTNAQKITYPQAVREIVKADGVIGLMGRGLKTRILANGMQGLMFSVLWKYFDDRFFKHTQAPKTNI